MNPPTPTPSTSLRCFAWFTVLATIGLIVMGGLVTSKEAGMAVPDWPTTYGYNVFWFPIHLWQGGVFYEHSHRIWASIVGLLTAILAGWIWVRETSGRSRVVGLILIFATLGLIGVRTQGMFIAVAGAALCFIGYGISRAVKDPQPLCWWAATAFAAVLVQGVLGGIRVTAMKDEIGIFHGTLAQLFLVLLAGIALSQTRLWRELPEWKCAPGIAQFRKPLLVIALLVLVQLILGASMRHQHAGLAVPDFPLAHGKVWPATDAAAIASYNRTRRDTGEPKPITAAQVQLHLTHRIGALTVFAASVWLLVRTKRALGRGHTLRKFAIGWHLLVVAQFALGAFTVLSNKAADVATLHVLLGALALVSISLAALCGYHLRGSDPAQA